MSRNAVLLLVLVPFLALAEDVPDSHDHPAVKRWPGSSITDAEYREAETFKFPVSDGATKKVEGRYLFNIYRLPPKVTCAQVARSFDAAFKALGFTVHSGTAAPAPDVVWPAGKWVSGEGNGRSGGQVFALAGCPADNFEGPELFVWVVDNQRLQPPVEPDAAALTAAITRNGRVALYGITFIAKKADVSPDSAHALEELATVLKNQPDWILRIEGHSDNAGPAKTNLALSKKRADAVKAWLVSKHGVADARLTTDGLGDQKPLSPNTTEIGRANNRRVEIAAVK